jgi:sugar phosphate isomerase/epimerase
METHDSWCNPEYVENIMRTVNKESIAVNWDVMHPVLTANFTVEGAFKALSPFIRHVHIHDGVYNQKILEFKPIGKGGVDHRKAMELLKKHEYAGYISGEWINWEPCEIHLPRELAMIKSY